MYVKTCEVREELLEREERLPLKVKMYKRQGAVVETVDQDGKWVTWVNNFILLHPPSSTRAHGSHH